MSDPWSDAVLAASIFAVDPIGCGGVALRAAAGPVRDVWLAVLRESLPIDAPWRRLPIHVSDSRLLGGLDLTATLSAGKPVIELGVLAEADGGVVLIAMAERVASSSAARITGAMDDGAVVRERDGFASRSSTRFGVVALDEGINGEERPPAGLTDRLAFHVDLDGIGIRSAICDYATRTEIAGARKRLHLVDVSDAVVTALCTAATALGVASLRASLHASRVARAHAALMGRASVHEEDCSVAARLVLAPRATRVPASRAQGDDTESAPADPAQSEPAIDPDGSQATGGSQTIDDIVLEAAIAAIPPGILQRLSTGGRSRSHNARSGRSGVQRRTQMRGRVMGVSKGTPRSGATLHVVETLRAAAPWQRLRNSVGDSRCNPTARIPNARMEVRVDDFRVARYKHRTETIAIFVVDASGSSALHRLAEAKGAVEMLLADCYSRRDAVALIGFRGGAAQVLLPPTRSLVRAKRLLAGLPGGGGTPLASGIDTLVGLASAVERSGRTPIAVLLTDGRANVGRDGKGGRARAEEDAISAARSVRAARLAALLIDTSPQPHPQAATLAAEMGAHYFAMPHADSGAMSRVVRAGMGRGAK